MFVHEDERGSLRTLATDGDWSEVNYIESRAGVVCGRHYHKSTLEMMFILEGEVTVETWKVGSADKTVSRVTKGDQFLIEPGYVHVMKPLTEARWLNFLSIPFDHKRPDVFEE